MKTEQEIISSLTELKDSLLRQIDEYDLEIRELQDKPEHEDIFKFYCEVREEKLDKYVQTVQALKRYISALNQAQKVAIEAKEEVDRVIKRVRKSSYKKSLF